MRIPKTVTILGKRFTVKNNLTEEQMRKEIGDGQAPLGAMNFSRKLILIQAHECKEEQIITFLHECNHAMQYIVGLSQVTNRELAEIWCESSANAMLDVFKALK